MSRFAVSEGAQPVAPQGGIIALLTAAVTIISLASLLVLVQTSHVATTGYDVRRLESIKDEWRQKNYELEAEIAQLKSLRNIEEKATAELKMVTATSYVHVTVKTKQPSRVTASQGTLPSAYQEKAAKSEDDLSWWQRLERFIPFWEGAKTEP